jgi:valyl-tRNA synthetase
VRFTTARLESLRQSFRISEQKVEYSRNFMNKIWNAARFALPELEGFRPDSNIPADLSAADRWILQKTHILIENCQKALEDFQFNYYADVLLRFFWHDFCDIYLELAKPAMKDKARRPAAQWTLHHVLDNVLRLMHPVIPFITEEIWARLPKSKADGKLLMLADWPAVKAEFKSRAQTAAQHPEIVDQLVGIVETIRTLKHEQGMGTKDTAKIAVRPDRTIAPYFEEILASRHIETLAHAEVTSLAPNAKAPANSVSMVIPNFEVYMEIDKPADPAAERARLMKERGEIESLLQRTRKTLGNEQYLAKAPADIVESAREKEAEYAERLNRLERRLVQLKGAAG